MVAARPSHRTRRGPRRSPRSGSALAGAHPALGAGMQEGPPERVTGNIDKRRKLMDAWAVYCAEPASSPGEVVPSRAQLAVSALASFPGRRSTSAVRSAVSDKVRLARPIVSTW